MRKSQENKGAWLDKEAAERRSILLRNDTFSAFKDAPVRLEIENAPSKVMKFYTTRGEELPADIESYEKDGTSIVWVKVPDIEFECSNGSLGVLRRNGFRTETGRSVD